MKPKKLKFLKVLVMSCLCAFSLADYDNVQVPYFKSVRCKHNPKYVYNVTCFAKSWSRTISTGTFVADIKVPLTKIMVCIWFVSNSWQLS